MATDTDEEKRRRIAIAHDMSGCTPEQRARFERMRLAPRRDYDDDGNLIPLEAHPPIVNADEEGHRRRIAAFHDLMSRFTPEQRARFERMLRAPRRDDDDDRSRVPGEPLERQSFWVRPRRFFRHER